MGELGAMLPLGSIINTQGWKARQYSTRALKTCNGNFLKERAHSGSGDAQLPKNQEVVGTHYPSMAHNERMDHDLGPSIRLKIPA